MYKISVPVTNENFIRAGREETVEQLRRFDAQRVFLSVDKYETDEKKRREAMKSLAENCRYLKELGFEVGAWIWTFWIKNNTRFRNMRSIRGTEISEFMCPSDSGFVSFAADYIKEIASCGVDIILFDDDFRYGFQAETPACLCDGHIKLINKITGESSTREELYEHIVTGKKNKFRDAFLQVNGDLFKGFAKMVRQAVDTVSPEIRVGFCACMSSWDADGTDAYEIAKILAGSTKPLVRLIGAPYWAAMNAWGNQLQDVIELHRMESSWTKNGEIEIMAEGDVYPRPRINCPASFLEGFDTAVRASGCTDGILKYGIDYVSAADYETGYARFHERNKDTYKAIHKMFDSKQSTGVRVYESMKKISEMTMPTTVNKTVNPQDMFFSKAARVLAYNSIPTVYEGEGVCGIVFDENARNMPLQALKNGLITDIAAAEILISRGVDVGIESITEEVTDAAFEYFSENGNRIQMMNARVYDIKLKEKAEILSYTETLSGKRIPVSYFYENADGNRFLVLNINTRCDNFNIFRHYARSRQLADAVLCFTGKRLPAYSYSNPQMYIQCKTDGEKTAVGIWNFFPDTAFEPVIELDTDYSLVDTINCNVSLSGNKAYLSDIPPFAFAGFEIKK